MKATARMMMGIVAVKMIISSGMVVYYLSVCAMIRDTKELSPVCIFAVHLCNDT
jgi:hypothetical protein